LKKLYDRFWKPAAVSNTVGLRAADHIPDTHSSTCAHTMFYSIPLTTARDTRAHTGRTAHTTARLAKRGGHGLPVWRSTRVLATAVVPRAQHEHVVQMAESFDVIGVEDEITHKHVRVSAAGRGLRVASLYTTSSWTQGWLTCFRSRRGRCTPGGT
jgi:hypothetical protein